MPRARGVWAQRRIDPCGFDHPPPEVETGVGTPGRKAPALLSLRDPFQPLRFEIRAPRVAFAPSPEAQVAQCRGNTRSPGRSPGEPVRASPDMHTASIQPPKAAARARRR